MASVSVVIPTLDEEARLGAALLSVEPADEVIVVDGGSRDATLSVAERFGARVFSVSPPRGAQLQRGALAATGDWLVFLHADTELETGCRNALGGLPAEVGGGAFQFALAGDRPGYRALEAMVGWRSRLLCLPYGDQALFVRSELYRRLGGFRPLALMEDVDFVRRLRAASRLAFPRCRALTSDRRWRRDGLVSTTLLNLGLLALYELGCPPTRLAALYGSAPPGREGAAPAEWTGERPAH